jgi:glutathione S-transferase
MQPNIMPRPDLEQLNVNYRRIPLLTIGKDVYCDTRLILRKLEALFPQGALGAGTGDQRIIERLLERWTGDAGVFARAATLIPLTYPTMSDPAFRKDRAQFSGRPWKLEALERARPEAMVHIRDAFEILESTILADGREWIFKTEKPSLGDIEGEWH